MPDDILSRLTAALADRYQIERELGSGGMATVYLARDLKHHRKVAIKVMRSELAAALGADRFLREIEITANLNHPHILPLLDSGEVDSFLFYVMPYVEGESLRDRLNREKQLPIDDALRIAGEVADALDFAHERNVLHRDIKPENILLEAKHAVVADFGIARAIEEAGQTRLTETGVAIGTPAYLSPEQASGSREIDGRSDIYALGCVLYEMLTGSPPFDGPTVQAIIARHIADTVASIRVVRPSVPDGVEQAVLRGLAKVPADRFRTAHEFADALVAGCNTATAPTVTATPAAATPEPAAGAKSRLVQSVELDTVATFDPKLQAVMSRAEAAQGLRGAPAMSPRGSHRTAPWLGVGAVAALVVVAVVSLPTFLMRGRPAGSPPASVDSPAVAQPSPTTCAEPGEEYNLGDVCFDRPPMLLSPAAVTVDSSPGLSLRPVELWIRVRADGSVAELRPAAVGDTLLLAAAIEYARSAQYRVARKDGEAVDGWFRATFRMTTR